MASGLGDLSNTGSLVSKGLLFGFAFGGLAISFCFICFRILVRWKLFGRLFWDDALVILAWTPFLATTIAWWTQREGLFILWYLTHGVKLATQHNIDLLMTQFKLLTAALVIFTTSLWFIKLSFLIFFRRLGTRQLSQRIWWWIVTVFTIATCVALVGAIPYQCSTTSDLVTLVERCGGPGLDYYQFVLFYCHLAADITTDILIISIPVLMFWNVRIPLKQKLGLIAIFSMTVLVILSAIIRIAVNRRFHSSNQDFLWLIFWASLELNMAIIVACCGAFRQLFKSAGRNEASAKSGSRETKKKGTIHSSTNYRALSPYERQGTEFSVIKNPEPVVHEYV